MSLGPTFSGGISAFLILREELQSKRWGMLKAVNTSVHWLSWLFSFTILGILNSIAGGLTAALLPNVHALESVNFASVFGTLLFLNVALVSASFFLAALCGTIQSTVLTIFIIIGIIVFSAAPTIRSGNSWYGYITAESSLNTYSNSDTGGGAFWLYGSTERGNREYIYNVDPNSTETTTTAETLTFCEVPLVSFEQSRNYKTLDERNNVPKEDIFQVSGVTTISRNLCLSNVFRILSTYENVVVID